MKDNGQLYNVVYTTSENDAEAAEVFKSTSAHNGAYVIDNGSLYEKLSAHDSSLVKIGIHQKDFDMMTASKVTAVDEDAVKDCAELETVIWNVSAWSVPSYAFADNDKLRSFTFRNVTNQTPTSCVIGEFAFRNCTSLESITIPSSVTEVGEGAFINCSSLSAIQWNTPSDIPKDAFSGCETLKSFGISSNSVKQVRSIGENAFKNCVSLSDIGGLDELQFTALEEIGANAFENCAGLDTLTIPSSVRVIGDNAFGGCEKLGGVKISGELEEIGATIFGEKAGESFFEVDNAAAFREKWGGILSRDYGEDAEERLIKGTDGISGEVPEASEEPEPSEAPEASESPEASELPEESEAPEADELPEESESPEADESPEVSEAPEVSE
jgi:hypothetical protein